ncbi:MAG: hypothetical protein HQ517_01305 [SAR324 cluster bacterium]|nr:hypothetical protein [SAR324 cluster bacterium]
MEQMTIRERMQRMLAHQEADRVPIVDCPWGSTLERWRREGLPDNIEWWQYFDIDNFVGIGVDNSPRYEECVIEETSEFVIKTTSWGATLRQWKTHGGVPEFIDFTITNPDAWRKARERLVLTEDRVPFDYLREHYDAWCKEDLWITIRLNFGFDMTHAWVVGTERVLEAMVLDPEWMVEMWNTELDLNLKLLDMVWDKGYRFNCISWCDDMGYKGTQFFSLSMYRELLKPVHRRAVQWAKDKGVAVYLHSCGNINAFIPDLIEIGIDFLNPLEVKAGMDPVQLKKTYGRQLAFHGGLNAVLFSEPEKLFAEMRRVVPEMKFGGGYILGSDHSIPDSVSLKDYEAFIALAKELGSYS